MIKRESVWKAKVYYQNGTTRTFLPNDKQFRLHSATGCLNARLYTFRDAYSATVAQAGSDLKNAEVWPVEIQYDTKTKQVIVVPPICSREGKRIMDYTSGKNNVEQGRLFEDYIEGRLRQLFTNVRRNVWTRGYSGQIWQIDFLLDDSLALEVSTEKRSEIKVNATFLKFVDISRNFENHKFALLLAGSYKKVYGRKGMEKEKYVNPLAPHKTFLAHNFAIVLADYIENLVLFYERKLDACHCSSIPPTEISTCFKEST